MLQNDLSIIKNWGLLREVMIDAFTITITNHLELMITLKIVKINWSANRLKIRL